MWRPRVAVELTSAAVLASSPRRNTDVDSGAASTVETEAGERRVVGPLDAIFISYAFNISRSGYNKEQ